MKKAFIENLNDLMANHADLITVTADMGFSVFEEMQIKYKDRFFNTGVTEQASIGFCAGLALSGYKVFFYAQAAFATMRCFEQVRLDLAVNELNVKIIGVNAGFSLNQLGASHFAIEDVGLMRLLPGMTVLTPGDPNEMKWAVTEAYKIKGPVYIRYSKIGNTVIHDKKTRFALGKPVLVQDGSDGVLFASGGILETALKVQQYLKTKKIKLALYSVPTVKPLNKKIILDIVRKKKYIFTLEEHNIIGGLGSAIAELLAESKTQHTLKRLGVSDRYTHVTGSIDYLLDLNGLSPKKISAQILKSLTE